MLTIARMKEIEDLADSTRIQLTVHDQFPVPMKTVMKRISDACKDRKITIAVSEVRMALDQAFTYFERGKAKIVLSKETAADVGIASRADFTLAHELGHAILHNGRRAFSRSLTGIDYRARAGVKGTKVLEAEANHFASAFLMPRSAINFGMTVDEVATKFKVARRTAELRLAAFSQVC